MRRSTNSTSHSLSSQIYLDSFKGDVSKLCTDERLTEEISKERIRKDLSEDLHR